MRKLRIVICFGVDPVDVRVVTPRKVENLELVELAKARKPSARHVLAAGQVE